MADLTPERNGLHEAATEAEKDEKKQPWGVLCWLKRGRGKKCGRDLVKLVNKMSRNPGWSL